MPFSSADRITPVIISPSKGLNTNNVHLTFQLNNLVMSCSGICMLRGSTHFTKAGTKTGEYKTILNLVNRINTHNQTNTLQNKIGEFLK